MSSASLPYAHAMKPLDSARTSIEVLPDGRLHLAIVHDVLRGVTPAMLEYWFQNIEGELEIEGTRCTRYTAWHPLDHVAYAVHARGADDTVGPGSVFHIHEVLGQDPAFEVDVLTDVTRLDRGGFAHRPRSRWGLRFARMDYEFQEVAGGTRYVNSMTIGLEGGWGARVFNRRMRPRVFSEAQGRAWLRHNVEEVGNLEQFLPAMFALAHGHASYARTNAGWDIRLVGT